jgi:hypothetical protein
VAGGAGVPLPDPGVRSVGSAHLTERNATMSAFIITRIQVGDYETWRPRFDQDLPNAREKAKVQRVFRDVDDPNHVFVFLEFASVEDAQEAQGRLVGSGVLDRFQDSTARTSSKKRPRLLPEQTHQRSPTTPNLKSTTTCSFHTATFASGTTRKPASGSSPGIRTRASRDIRVTRTARRAESAPTARGLRRCLRGRWGNRGQTRLGNSPDPIPARNAIRRRRCCRC